MNNGLYVSAAALRIHEYRQQVTANNLANANTPAFKGDLLVVRSRQLAPAESGMPSYLAVPILDEVTQGLRSGGTYVDFSQGALVNTGRELDVALDGDGFFAVSVDGAKRYTRDGRLDRDAEGYLATVSGRHRLLDAADRPISLPSGKVTVDDRGGISVNGVPQARLAVFRFDDPAALSKAGGNTYVADDAARAAPAAASVRQGQIEASGVNQARTLVDMLAVQRMYEASAKMIQFADSMLGRAVNDIAKLV